MGSNKKEVATLKNALRNAQLDKRELLLFRKFDYGRQLFFQYLKIQKIMQDSELPLLEATFNTPLPITFRLHATDPRAGVLAARLRDLAARRPNPPVKALAWMPDGQGWQAIGSTKASAVPNRRDKLHPDVFDVVRDGTEAGLLARQEAVSMLPVLVLAPAALCPGSRVLDVCAAPGNKTMQLLERVSPPELTSSGGSVSGVSASGLVVANDAHHLRVKTLQDAIARHCRSTSELQSLVVSCAMGQDIPVPAFTSAVSASAGGGGGGAGDRGKTMMGYDAVLADVPCSGDGTIRKDPDVLRRWHPGGGNALHATQLAVARRAALLVRPGGHLLYSTCSLNPVEDEAVVAGVLTGPGGDQFELVDGAVALGVPGMKHRPGLATWGVAEHVFNSNSNSVRYNNGSSVKNQGSRKVGFKEESQAKKEGSENGSDDDEDKDEDDEEEVSLRWHSSHREASAAGMPAAELTMWPPPPVMAGGGGRGDGGGGGLHLERCARFLPHDQDTGGFFIALLRRRQGPASVVAASNEVEELQQAVNKTRKRAAAKDAAAARATSELPEPVRPLPPGEAAAVASALGLGGGGSGGVCSRLWRGARGTVTLAPLAADLHDLGGVTMASAGVTALVARKVFVKGEHHAASATAAVAAEFPYDFTQAGAEALGSLARKRRVQALPTDLQLMLAARAAGITSSSAGEEQQQQQQQQPQRKQQLDDDEEVCLIGPDELTDATRRRWEQTQAKDGSGSSTWRGAAVLVLLKRTTAAGAGVVVFAVAGRCCAGGLALSPEVTAEQAKQLLTRLSEVAGSSRRTSRPTSS